MIRDLKKEIHNFLEDLNKNIKDEKELLYVKTRATQLIDMMLIEMDKILDYREDEIKAVIKKQAKDSEKLKEMQEKLEYIYQDIYEDQDSFLITCPYCGAEFDAWVDDDLSDIKCPECSNIIELDWGDNMDDDDQPDDECNGNCSHCDGCD